MSFYALGSASLFLLIGPLVLFYFLKLKRPRLDIPSLFLWRQVIKDSRVNTPFQRFKRNLLLLLQILLLALLALAAMQPYWHGEAAQRRRLPILIDCSASMAALDKAGGTSRLEAARQKVRQLVEGLLSDQELCLVSFGRTARKRTGFTNNKRILREALEQIQVEDVPSDIEDALRMAQALSRSVPFDEVLLLSDGNFPARADFELSFDLNYQQLPAPGPNMGLTSLSARRSGGKVEKEGSSWDLFVRIESTHKSETPTTVELLARGEVVSREYISVGKDQPRRMVFHVAGETACSLTVRLTPEGFDSLPSDNTAFIELPAARSLSVYIPSSMAVYRHAIGASSGMRLCSEKSPESQPSSLKPQASSLFDLVITDRAKDLEIEGRTCLYVGLVPGDLKEHIVVEKGGTEILAWRRSSALLQNVELADLVILDQPRTDEKVRESDFENLGYEVLAHGNRGPLVLEKRTRRNLSFYMLFHSDRSTLPYRVGFPVLVANLVELAWKQSKLSEADGGHTGVLPPLTLLPDRAYRIEGPHGSVTQGRTGPEGVLSGIGAPLVGWYVISELKPQGGHDSESCPPCRIGASLLSASETQLGAIEKIQFNELSVSAASRPVKAERSLWYLLAVIAFCVALGEWWFFHRRR
jgi:hypothetical protein